MCWLFSLPRWAHPQSICGEVPWRRWRIGKSGSAQPHLHGLHGLRHGQLLSSGGDLTELRNILKLLFLFADVNENLELCATAALPSSSSVYKCSSASSIVFFAGDIPGLQHWWGKIPLWPASAHLSHCGEWLHIK